MDSEASMPDLPASKLFMMDYATPISMVSAFCRAVFANVIPHDFFGVGDIQIHNLHIFFRNIDRFIGLRRFETLTLHETSQGIKVSMELIPLAP